MSERKKLDQMRRRLSSLHFDILVAEGEHQPPFVLSTMREAFRNNQALTQQYESKVLIQEAESWGIEIPAKEDWREIIYISGFGIDGVKVDDLDKARPVTVLSAKGRTMITKQIREARLAYWKSWAEILIPILSLLVAIIALLKG